MNTQPGRIESAFTVYLLSLVLEFRSTDIHWQMNLFLRLHRGVKSNMIPVGFKGSPVIRWTIFLLWGC